MEAKETLSMLDKLSHVKVLHCRKNSSETILRQIYAHLTNIYMNLSQVAPFLALVPDRVCNEYLQHSVGFIKCLVAYRPNSNSYYKAFKH